MLPRTVAEYAARGITVTLCCQSCRGVQALAPDVLEATFGPDFDLIAGKRQVASQLYCPLCGARLPDVILEAPQAAPAAQLEGVTARRRANG